MRVKFLCLLLLMMFASGCQRKKPVRIGSKKFTEQLILAEMIALLCEKEGIPVKREIPYGDTFECGQALEEGEIDVYPEYTGTGLLLLGHRVIREKEKAYSIVKDGYKKRKITWFPRIGFANDYVLVMKRNRAISTNIYKIEDLENFPDKLRFGCDSHFLNRPRDGLEALLRRYGLRGKDKYLKPLIIDSKIDLYHALLDEKVDVVIGYVTDAQIQEFGLQVLEDNSSFFPIYEVAPVVRDQALKTHPKLGEVLKKLKGLITEEEMRKMNHKVELEGENYKHCARNFLSEKGLLAKAKQRSTHLPIEISLSKNDELDGAAGKAIRAIRKVFQRRPLNLKYMNDPKKGLLSEKKQSKLAILGAESFFKLYQDRYFVLDEESKIKAFAVLGYRMCHLLTLKNSKIKELSQIKKLGVGSKNSSSYRTADILYKSLKLKIEFVEKKLSEQIKLLKEGKIDAVLLMVRPGFGELQKIMRKEPLQLVPLTSSISKSAIPTPFFSLTRIPAKSYNGQKKTR